MMSSLKETFYQLISLTALDICFNNSLGPSESWRLGFDGIHQETVFNI